MAIDTTRSGVRAGERETGRVVIGGIGPTDRTVGVARLAVEPEAGGRVIRIRRLAVVGHVALGAIGRRADKRARLLGAVAGIAVSGGMHTGQWETTVGVFREHVILQFPIARRMTILAIGGQLSLMRVGVAVHTVRFHLIELQVGMTTAAVGLRVRADEFVPRLLMLEHRLVADRAPRLGRVAILAIPLECFMGTLRRGHGQPTRTEECTNEKQRQQTPVHRWPPVVRTLSAL